MRLPLLWLHDYCDPGLEPFELATRLALTGTEVDRVHTHGVTALEHFVVGKVLRVRAPPGRRPADASASSTPARASRRRSSAARRTSPPARPSRSRGPAR